MDSVKEGTVPEWWLTFMEDNEVDAVHDAIELNRILKEHNGSFRVTQDKSPWGDRYLDFETRDDAILFLLKYQK